MGYNYIFLNEMVLLGTSSYAFQIVWGKRKFERTVHELKFSRDKLKVRVNSNTKF